MDAGATRTIAGIVLRCGHAESPRIHGVPDKHTSRSPSPAGQRGTACTCAPHTFAEVDAVGQRGGMTRFLRAFAALVSVVVLVGAQPSEHRTDEWAWPVDPPRVVRAYAAPAHAYGPGHRGIDLAASALVRAPADGVVAFSGRVVDRGVVTIDHGDGLVTTLEPVEDAPPVGSVVARGDAVGVVRGGGHTAEGAVHFGVRRHGEYINPALLLGGVPRAVLLPCC